jgi:hypothetical protein
MRRMFSSVAVFLLSVAGVANAQSLDSLPPPAMLLPGSLNVSVGTLAPAEPGNVIGSATAEQGFTALRFGRAFVVGFVDITRRHDSDGLAWNRTTPVIAGAKLVAVTSRGVIQAAVGIAANAGDRTLLAEKALYASYWTNWRADVVSARSSALPDAFPGHLYASSGWVTAAEPGNWITTVSLQQGMTLARHRRLSAIPFIGVGATADTAEYTWNNRLQADAGAKLALSIPSGVIELGAAQRHQQEWLTGRSRSGPVFFANLWIGWAPRFSTR